MKHCKFFIFLYIAFVSIILIGAIEKAISIDMPVAVDSRRQTFVYSPNEVFEIKGHIEYKTFLQFPEDELILSYNLGDNYSWSIMPDVSYPNTLIIQPIQKDVRTNLIILTNKKRTYIFDLISKENADYDVAYSVNFYYPETEGENFDQLHGDLTIFPEDQDYNALVKNFDLKDDDYKQFTRSKKVNDTFKNDAKNGKLGLVNSESVLNTGDLGLNFSYDITGDKGISPFEVFDNGKVTFFKFPLNAKNLPVIYVVQRDGSQKKVKMVLYKEYVLIDGVYRKMILRSHERKVYIRNNSDIISSDVVENGTSKKKK